ncbi:nucleic-acid-binding protein from transposon X-element [Trichonephila clavipes]|nr:nucleic-acid-binding protein from transposon X-element [Trichonephila clavipes]
MTNRKTGLPMPLFLLTLPKNNINKDIFNMTELCYLKIKVEPLRPKIGPAQCFRCQGFFHSSKYCTRNPKCVKCGQPHLTRSCTKTSATEATCCNCQEGKCKRQRKPKPTQQDLQQPLHQPTPPTSESSPSKHYHSPPVSAAPVPKPRPAPTPSTSQTSTPAINSTSNNSNPPSTIAETLKQLREPKVVEIFQVLKQVIAICNSDMPLADRAIEVAALLQIDLPI